MSDNNDRLNRHPLNQAWWALRLGLGLGPFLAGLDKFFNILTDWTMYLNPLALKVVPLSPAVFMRTVGVIEMVVGIAILTRWTRLGAYVAAAWLVGIALNLALMGTFFDVAVRDVEIALAAFVLAKLTEVRFAKGNLRAVAA
ncbi:MAG TPA: DoxX family membrane protein [Terriglobales bacterium]|nr:DoxX family membrane protein [Terriglobales bacterium]